MARVETNVRGLTPLSERRTNGDSFLSISLRLTGADPRDLLRLVAPPDRGERPESDGRESNACSLLSASTALAVWCRTTGESSRERLDPASLVATLAYSTRA